MPTPSKIEKGPVLASTRQVLHEDQLPSPHSTLERWYLVWEVSCCSLSNFRRERQGELKAMLSTVV